MTTMPSKQQKIPISPEDKEFFQEFYGEYKGFLFYIANKYTRNQSDCEDIVQDAVVRLMCNISSIRDLNKFKTAKYIALTVRSAWLDLVKKQKDTHEIPLDEAILESMIELDPLSSRDPSDLQLEVIHLKQSLSQKEWMILEGKYLLGYDQEELSRMIGVSPDSVRMTLCRARSNARSILLSDAEKDGENNG